VVSTIGVGGFLGVEEGCEKAAGVDWVSRGGSSKYCLILSYAPGSVSLTSSTHEGKDVIPWTVINRDSKDDGD
jgi:hypothetical protein